LRAFGGAGIAAPEAGLLAAMPRVEIREAAAPATSAVEKFRLVIIIIVILMAWRINGQQKAVRVGCRSGELLRVLYFWERHLPEHTVQMCPPSCIPIRYRGCFVYAKARSLTVFVFLAAISVNNWMRNRCVMSYLHAKMRHANVFAYKRQWTLEKQE
jgi:hypothetical protein